MASWYSEKLLKPKVWTFHPIFDAFHHEDLDQTSKRNLFSVTHKKLTPQTDFRRSNTILIDFGKTNKKDWQRLYLSINYFWKHLNEIYQVHCLKSLLFGIGVHLNTEPKIPHRRILRPWNDKKFLQDFTAFLISKWW